MKNISNINGHFYDINKYLIRFKRNFVMFHDGGPGVQVTEKMVKILTMLFCIIGDLESFDRISNAGSGLHKI